MSRALEALFKDDIEANLTGGALQDSNTFRLENCYTEVVDSVLMSRGVSLKAIFDVYASLDATDVAKRHLAKLLSADEWMALLRDLEWVDEEFTMREASLAFTWSRMRVIDESSAASRKKMENLSYEVNKSSNAQHSKHRQNSLTLRPPHTGLSGWSSTCGNNEGASYRYRASREGL